MRFQLRLIFVILKFVFYLPTNVNGRGDEEVVEESLQSRNISNHKKLYDTVVRRPTAAEITNAISDPNLFQEIQAESLHKFFFTGQYPSGFIQLLNTYETLSPNPIKLSDGEILMLTFKYDRGSLNRRIVTQLKFYRKIQEIQCMSYVLLNVVLPKVKDDGLKSVSDYVYYMIDMSYKGKFVVTPWLWDLYIKLLGLRQSKLEPQTFLETHLTGINETLQKMITSCRVYNYLKEDFDYSNQDVLMKMYLKIHDRSYQYFIENNESQKLYIRTIENFFVTNPWKIKAAWFPDQLNLQTGFVFNWKNIYDVLQNEMAYINDQHAKREWITQPSKYIKYHEIILDVVLANFYNYIWLHLVVYQKTGIKALLYHEVFLDLLTASSILHFIYIEDQILNEVLILLSQIYLPDDEKINELINILSEEVNRILKNVSGPNYPRFRKAIIHEVFVIEKSENKDSEFLKYHAMRFEQFVEDTIDILSGFNLSLLSFYINGNETVDFVFPNKGTVL
ncbi:uncharacterized protein LOC126839971 [Adelges cooleyi]|uniref:uncharacterized protein LOC126839971 n=1 Tax=Adelges cooleyi TaxID=133065 RepID=UPI00217F6CBB|nr:uncharacterized protein LOC126839971 [Adelges cooleyi]